MQYESLIKSVSKEARQRIEKQVKKLFEHKFGNCSRIRTCNLNLSKNIDLNECKIDFGPGYRVYFIIQEGAIKILNAGIKKDQKRDVQYAINEIENE